MRLFWREVLRKPKSFVVPVGTLLLLALLLLYPSAILDGVVQDGTAALRNAPADLIVYAHDANGVILRSRVEPETRAAVAVVDGVESVSSFDVMLLTGKVMGDDKPLGLAVLASDAPIAGGGVPGIGEAIVDQSLHERGVLIHGSQLLIGPFHHPVTVKSFTHGTNLLFSGGVIVNKSTWLAALGDNAGAAAAEGGATDDPAVASAASRAAGSQALLVKLKPDADEKVVAAAIDKATGGETDTMTRSAAVKAMPGVKQQEATFGYIRMVTFSVALVVVGLFLSFLTLERGPLYAAMKAIGASSSQLSFGMVMQVLWITDLALYLAIAGTWLLTKAPVGIPTELRMARIMETGLALRTAAVVGASLSLRRVMRIDPADAIG
jgi:putative ABC transport system permease protein